MTRLKERIAYQYEETSTGGRVRIVTRDPDALAAVHAFLHFQIEDHRTGDSGAVQRPASGRMNGMGPGMMAMGHDAATMVQMRDIHELFINHDRITRTVTNLPDGIRTATESADPRIAQLLKDHVSRMRQRVDIGDDPGLPSWKPVLAISPSCAASYGSSSETGTAAWPGFRPGPRHVFSTCFLTDRSSIVPCRASPGRLARRISVGGPRSSGEFAAKLREE